MTWHADPALLERYALGVTDEARSVSIEAHLLACTACRGIVAGMVDALALERIWASIDDRLDAPRLQPVEWVLTRLGVQDHVARLLAATPSLHASWFVAVAIALVFAVMGAYAGERGLLLFLVLAPLVPLAGVAAAYGPGIDPTYEIGLAAPLRSFRLLLIRSLAVLATSTIIAGAASLALPRLGWTTAAWLLPSLGLSALSLALSTAIPPAWAFGSVAFGWIGVSLLSEFGSPAPFAAFRIAGQLASLAILLVAGLVVARRREAFDIRRNP
jgi:hypothetical protein